jgi:hypothetical protein
MTWTRLAVLARDITVIVADAATAPLYRWLHARSVK